MDLNADRLVKRYRGRAVVDGISLDLSPGEIVGLLGHNGAGKTTTFYMVTGLVRPDSGHVWLGGREITRQPMFRRARAGIGYLPQEPSVFRRLSVEDGLRLVLEFAPLTRRERENRIERLLEEFHLTQVRHQAGYSLSGGERRRSEIARCMALEPTYILLDEPFTGVDPIEVSSIQQTVARLKTRGIGVLITDHNAAATLAATDRAYVVKAGRLLTSGSARDVMADPLARREYLGEDFPLP